MKTKVISGTEKVSLFLMGIMLVADHSGLFPVGQNLTTPCYIGGYKSVFFFFFPGDLHVWLILCSQGEWDTRY
jgi:hypothetical protein